MAPGSFAKTPAAASRARARTGTRGEPALRFAFGLGLGFSLGFGRRFGCNTEVHPFEDGQLRGVTLALVQLHDAGVTAVALFVSGSDFVEEDLHGIFLVQPGGGNAAVVQGAAFAQRDHFLGHGTGRLGLRQGGRDAVVLDEAANQIGQHRIPV